MARNPLLVYDLLQHVHLEARVSGGLLVERQRLPHGTGEGTGGPPAPKEYLETWDYEPPPWGTLRWTEGWDYVPPPRPNPVYTMTWDYELPPGGFTVRWTADWSWTPAPAFTTVRYTEGWED